ncbi:hypothetical protein ES703_27785 [subsurface metagenome]
MDEPIDVVFTMIINGFEREMKNDFQTVLVSDPGCFLGEGAERKDGNCQRFLEGTELAYGIHAVTHIIDDDRCSIPWLFTEGNRLFRFLLFD